MALSQQNKPANAEVLPLQNIVEHLLLMKEK